jgi:4-amino-4-deoxychorismate lyase
MLTTEEKVFSLNGDVGPQSLLDNRAMAYGDGLFETMCLQGGRVCFLGFHIERLLDGAGRLGFALDVAVLKSELEAFVAHLKSDQVYDGVIKVLLARGGAAEGYRYDTGLDDELRLLSYRPRVFFQPESLEGIRSIRCHTTLAVNPKLAGMKHLNRLEQVLARAEWSDPSVREGLMYLDSGELIEGTMSNVFCVKAACLYTPDLSMAGVCGIMRRVIIELLAPALGLDIVVGRLAEEDVLSADEVFISNSLIGIWPLKSYETKEWSYWPVAHRLQLVLESCRESHA